MFNFVGWAYSNLIICIQELKFRMDGQNFEEILFLLAHHNSCILFLLVNIENSLVKGYHDV